MVRIFKHYVSVPFLLLSGIEGLLLMASIYTGLFLRWADTSRLGAELRGFFPEAAIFTGVILISMFAVGLYQKEVVGTLRLVFVRLLVSFAVSVTVLSLLFYLVPSIEIWRSAFVIGSLLAIVGILVTRFVFIHVTDLASFKRRLLVMGTGERAAQIHEFMRGGDHNGSIVVGYLPCNEGDPRVNQANVLPQTNDLQKLVQDLGVEEIVIAADDRRGGLPIDALLDCKMQGIRILGHESFWERETGRVELSSLSPSWLVFSDGFAGVHPVHALLKRAFDIVVSVAFLLFSLPVIAVTALLIRLESRGPILYKQERVGMNGRPFMLYKFRSMRTDAEQDGVPRWAAVNDSRITRVGQFIRQTRIDEIPQILNVLKGDMSFIGPRPERPFFVDELRRQIPYYAERHRVKPGISGWAQLNYPYGASVEDAVEKLQYDLYYIKNYSILLDLIILLQTAHVILWPRGVR